MHGVMEEAELEEQAEEKPEEPDLEEPTAWQWSLRSDKEVRKTKDGS
jgi:hypothetical protein